MSEISTELAAKAIATEYTLRLRNAVARARMAQADLNGPHSAFLEENRENFLGDIRLAHKLAEDGFRLDLLCETTGANGAWLAAEAIVIYYEVVEGEIFICADLPGCNAARICRMNAIVKNRLESGKYKPIRTYRFYQPVPHTMMADGCPEITGPKIYLENEGPMIAHADACDDTATSHRVR